MLSEGAEQLSRLPGRPLTDGEFERVNSQVVGCELKSLGEETSFRTCPSVNSSVSRGMPEMSGRTMGPSPNGTSRVSEIDSHCSNVPAGTSLNEQYVFSRQRNPNVCSAGVRRSVGVAGGVDDVNGRGNGFGRGTTSDSTAW